MTMKNDEKKMNWPTAVVEIVIILTIAYFIAAIFNLGWWNCG